MGESCEGSMDKLLTNAEWWIHLPDKLGDLTFSKLLRTLKLAANSRGIGQESSVELLEKLCTSAEWWGDLPDKLDNTMLREVLVTLRSAAKMRGGLDDFKRGDIVMVKVGPMEGRLATVVNPNWHSRLKVKLRRREVKKADEDGM